MEKNTYKSDLPKMWKKSEITARFALCQHCTNCSQHSHTTHFTTDLTVHNQNTRKDFGVHTKRWIILQDTNCLNKNAGSGYQNVFRESLWKALEKCGIESHYISLLRRLFAEQKGTVSTDKESNLFEM